MRLAKSFKFLMIFAIATLLGFTACDNMQNRQAADEPETTMDFREARNEINQQINQLAQTIRQTNYETREEIEENLEERIENLKERVEELEEAVDEAEMSQALQQDFEAAEERLEEMEDRLNDWTIINEEEWDEFQTNFARTAEEFGNEMEALFTDNDYFDEEEY